MGALGRSNHFSPHGDFSTCGLIRFYSDKAFVTRHENLIRNRRSVVSERLREIGGGLRLQGDHCITALLLKHEAS